MTGTTRSSDGLNVRRRKLLFRSWHRGMRELDLILGTFADARIAALTETQLDQYERLLDTPDTEMLLVITEQTPAPDHPDAQMIETILAFGRTSNS